MKYKKYVLLLIMSILLFPLLVRAESRYLYDVIKNESESNGFARKYTGNHHDSFMNEPSKNIYYWFAEENYQGEELLNKTNVVFADFCWKMIRTTDTGGVKLVYNGEVENGKCLSTRSPHIGYGNVEQLNMRSNDYYYATDYSYNKTTQKFQLEGDKIHNVLNETTKDQLLNHYTCRSTDANGTCSTVYYFYRYTSGNNGYFLPINTSTSYDSIGNTPFNVVANSPAYVGYMYGDVYTTSSTYLTDFVSQIAGSLSSITYNIGSSITDNGDGTYTINNPVEVTKEDWATDYNNYRYHYYCDNGGIICRRPYYITDGTKNGWYFFPVYIIKMAKTHDGYTLINPIDVRSDELLKDFSAYAEYKYTCLDNSSVCTDYNYSVVFSESQTGLQYYKNYYIGTGAEWNGTEYVLVNPVSTEEYFNRDLKNTHHFWCENNGKTSCSTVSYITYKDIDWIFRFSFKNGEEANVQTALNNMLKKNQNNSLAKSVIENWYEKNMLDYTDYLEDTIYCNDRTIKNYAGWSSTGDPEAYNHFNPLTMKNEAATLYDLNCEQITDQFSTNNSQAKLTYPVGLVTVNELNLLKNRNAVEKIGSWTMTASYFSTSEAYLRYALPGNLYGDKTNKAHLIKPMISLKPKTQYLSGTGTEENPYIVSLTNNYAIDVVIKNETKDLNIGIDDLTQVESGKEVLFKVTPIKGYKVTGIEIIDEEDNEINYVETNEKDEYKFIMPESNVTIIPSYEKTSAAIHVEDNAHTKEIVIEVNDVKAVVYEDEVKFTIIPEDGYELENIIITDENGNTIKWKKTSKAFEYSFVMPDTDVTITPVFKKVVVPVEPDIVNPYTNRSLFFLWILCLLGVCGLISFKRKKNRLS